MRLINTKEQDAFWRIFEPYITIDGLNVTLREDAPQEAIDAEARYYEIFQQHRNEVLEEMDLI